MRHVGKGNRKTMGALCWKQGLLAEDVGCDQSGKAHCRSGLSGIGRTVRGEGRTGIGTMQLTQIFLFHIL